MSPGDLIKRSSRGKNTCFVHTILSIVFSITDIIHFLSHVWPWARNLSVQHDSYTCAQYPGSTAFPTRRTTEKANYVSAAPNDLLLASCPAECRPEGHKDWIYC